MAASRFPKASASSKIVMEGLTFDDILLLPRFVDFKRSEVNLSTKLHPSLHLKLPVISSPMDTVTEAAMAIAMASNGGLGIIHRSLTVQNQAAMVTEVKSASVADAALAAVDSKGRLLVGAAVGPGADLDERVDALLAAEVDVIVVDSGHGHSAFILEGVKAIKKRAGKVPVMAGNVATKDGAKAIIDAGADIIRVGMGPGSICTTRVVTGMGVPQITAVLDAVEAAKGTDVAVVADGGIRQIGDMAKALGCGAHAVMIGSMLAGHDESPGEKIEQGGKLFKKYRGMGSIGAMQKGGAERYGQSRNQDAKKLIAEGVEAVVPYRGAVGDFLYQIGGGLRSSFYYVGTKTMSDFHTHAQFVRITTAGLLESHPHTVHIADTGGSYLLER